MKKASVIKIGKKLQSIRKTHGYTQEKMAEKIECSTRYIGDIEQDRSKPSYEVLVKICNTFNISMDEIFSGYLDKIDGGHYKECEINCIIIEYEAEVLCIVIQKFF